MELRGAVGEVALVVQDQGIGFDVEKARRTQGHGLVSMQERLNLVNGRFQVESSPGLGTTIRAFIPLITSARFEEQSIDKPPYRNGRRNLATESWLLMTTR